MVMSQEARCWMPCSKRTVWQRYFPSEFGIDHRYKDFAHNEWDRKINHQKKADSKAGLHVCAVYVSLFLEDSFGPWFGLNTRKGRWEVIGDGFSVVSYTALDDIGNVVASLATMPLEKVPHDVRISGSAITLQDAATLFSSISGHKIEVVPFSLEQYKGEQVKKPEANPAGFLRFLMGEGQVGLEHRLQQ